MSANLAALKAELDASPNSAGIVYTGDDVADAGLINAKGRSRPRASMTASEVLNATDDTERAAVEADAAKNVRFWNLMNMGDLNPFGVEATIMVELFGGGSATITALQAARAIMISRAEELGLLGSSKAIGPAHIAAARAL